MVETKSGKIKSVSTSSGTSRKGDWIRWLFELEDGSKYSTFSSDIGESFKAGDNVEMKLEQKGQFKNLVGMRIVDTPTQAETAAKTMELGTTNELLRKILAELKDLGNMVSDLQNGNRE